MAAKRPGELRRRGAAALFVCVFLGGCDWIEDHIFDPHPTPPEVLDDGPSHFTFAYSHQSSLVNVTVTIGLWMHKARRHERSAIADWLEVPNEGKELLEPINVVWIDPIAGSEPEARDAIVDFLSDCDFKREGDEFFGLIPRHSSGYAASYGNSVWKEQYDPDDAWVEGFLGGQFPNRHGRVFPAYRTTPSDGSAAFITSGAFSREDGLGTSYFLSIDCLVARENCHAYLSFNQARDQLACGAAGWQQAIAVDFGNSYPYSAARSFWTGDHDLVLVFERLG